MRLSDWIEVAEIRSDLSQYRPRAAALLRKYFRMSVEIGRLPSLIGREFFRSQVTSYSTHTFEDTVIFVHDMERSLELLDPPSQTIIARIFFQEYSYDEAAQLFRISRRSVARKLAGAIDALSIVLLDRGLMRNTEDPISRAQVKPEKRLALPPERRPVPVGYLVRLRHPKSCQAQKFKTFTQAIESMDNKVWRF